MKIKLLVVQFEAIAGDIDKNILKIQELLEKSNYCSADLIVLPELWTIGWDSPNFNKSSEPVFESKAYNFLKEIAIKYNANIFGGSAVLRKDGEKDRNTCLIFDRQGNLISTYDKFHLFSHRGQSEGSFLEEGETPVIVKTDIGKIGVSICYDIRFPELYRAYRKAGADILVNMAAWGSEKKIPWDSMTTSRAVENQTYFVALTQTGKLREGANLGHSMILDYKGDILSEINLKEDGIYATIDLEEMYTFREKCRVLEDIKDSYEVVIK